MTSGSTCCPVREWLARSRVQSMRFVSLIASCNPVGWVSGAQTMCVQTTTLLGRRVTQRIYGRQTVGYGERTVHGNMHSHAERGNEE